MYSLTELLDDLRSGADPSLIGEKVIRSEDTQRRFLISLMTGFYLGLMQGQDEPSYPIDRETLRNSLIESIDCLLEIYAT